MTFNSHCPLEAFYLGFQLPKENQLASNRSAEDKYKTISKNFKQLQITYVYKKRSTRLTYV